VQRLLNTSHPYTQGAEGPVFWTLQQLNVGSLKVPMRVHFKVLDTDTNEGPSLWNPTLTAMYAAYMGYHQGEKWSGWFGASVSGSFRALKLGWGTVSGNCPPTGPCTGGWNYSGFATSEYEYQRFDSSYVYFPPIRFPGHYYDEETDLFENWHRNYHPAIGRYLSPEPLLQSPWWVRGESSEAHTTPTYSYVRNNPVASTDPNGLYTVDPRCKGKFPSEADLKARIRSSITDFNLRDCIERQINAAHISCDLWSKLVCKVNPDAAAAHKRGECTAEPNWDDTVWCDKEFADASCTQDILVHEFAHACGWKHGDGKGVPANSGALDPKCQPTGAP
jgi:RHS repeat-associated protein